MKFERYEKYKDSGIEWIGEIPEHWEVKRIKDVVHVNRKSIIENTSPHYRFSYIDIGNVNYNGIIKHPEIIEFENAPSRARRIVQRNDIIISTVRTYLKAIAFFENDTKDVVASTGFAVLTHKKEVNPRFLRYFIISEFFIDEVNKNSLGIGYPAINSSTLSSMFTLISFSEQTKIANFLDKKTAHIDKKIELLEQKITKYEELKKTLINETVCRGLDKSVELKDSGIEWIGEIPKHWKELRIKDVAKINPYTSKNKNANGKIEFLPMSSIDEKTGRIKEFLIESLDNVKQGYTAFKNDDILFAKITPCMENGNCVIVSGLSHNLGFGSTEFIVFRSTRLLYNKFLHLFLRNKLFRIVAEQFMKGSAGQKRIPTLYLTTHLIGIPPLSEQITIANSLDEKCEKIDTIIQTIKQEIELLKEFRKTLINDVVTGKIKVPDA